jgi:hypothetical protein
LELLVHFSLRTSWMHILAARAITNISAHARQATEAEDTASFHYAAPGSSGRASAL